MNSVLYRNRKSICRRSREKYQKFTSKPSRSTANPAPVPSTFQQICSIEKEHSKLVGSNLHEYLSGIYSDYCGEGSNSVFTNALRPIEILYDDTQRLQSDILSKDGLGLAWKKAEEVRKQLRNTMSMIEDIYCYALLGPDELKKAHEQRELAYQSLWLSYTIY